jgi:hypothetical protein
MILCNSSSTRLSLVVQVNHGTGPPWLAVGQLLSNVRILISIDQRAF